LEAFNGVTLEKLTLIFAISSSACFTVDINPETKPDLVGDAQTLDGIPDNKFNR
jgi:hypothetical protein